MRALVYRGPKNVSVDEVPDATVERPTDALVKITTTNICGSDLHMYEGRTDVEEGKALGYESAGAANGYASMGPHNGGQAELRLRDTRSSMSDSTAGPRFCCTHEPTHHARSST